MPGSATFSAPSSHDAGFCTAAPLLGPEEVCLLPCETHQGRPEQNIAHLTTSLSLAPSDVRHCLSLLPCLPVPLPGKTREPAARGFLQLHLRTTRLFQGWCLFLLERSKGGRGRLSSSPRSQHQQTATASARPYPVPDLVSPGIFICHPLPCSC